MAKKKIRRAAEPKVQADRLLLNKVVVDCLRRGCEALSQSKAAPALAAAATLAAKKKPNQGLSFKRDLVDLVQGNAPHLSWGVISTRRESVVKGKALYNRRRILQSLQ